VSDLPDEWEQAALSSLIAPDGIFCDGDWVESKDQDPNGSIRLLQLADIGDGVFLDKSKRFINEVKFEELRCTELFENDVLVARMPSPLGRACLMPRLPQRCITVVDVAVIRPGKHSVSSRWLKHSLNSPVIRQTIDTLSSGTTRQRISRKNLGQLNIPVPPLNEQKSIADKLDALLARVDTCRERLNRLPRILKRLRQSVLTAGTSGQLTEDWREEDSWEDGRPVNWCLKTFGELVESSLYGPRFSAKSYSADGVPTIRTTDIDFDGAIVLQDTPRVSVSSQELEKWGLLDGDLLVTRTGSTIGKCAIYHKSLGPAIPSAYLIRFRLNQHDISPKFVLLFLLSPKGQSLLISSSNAVAQPNVNAKTISQFLVPIPPLSEQREIVRRVEKLFTYVERLEARYQKALRRVEQLTSSLLSTAFRGELVPQDPNDEPASVLLDRIRAEQAAQPTKPKRGGTRRKPTMTKMSDESVKEVIRQLPKDTFSFDELREKLPDDENYDLLKDILFDLLDKADIRQVFDRESQAMRFIKGHK
jgi:type I restriction enzyme S subunit